MAYGVSRIAYGVWWFLFARLYESRDDAYVAGNVVQVMPQVAGTVIAINADDTERVEAGKTLIALDPSDAKVALAQAEAQLAQAVRETRTLFVNTGALNAGIALRNTEMARPPRPEATHQPDRNRCGIGRERRPCAASRPASRC